MIEIKKLSGIMNKDDKEENILPNQHIDALNIRFYGGANGLTAQNIPGNTLIPNPLLPAGENEGIGGYYDSVKQRIIWGNWNSNAHHGIYKYDIQTGVVSRLLECFVSSQTDILGFDRDYPMADPKIIYTTETDGDIFIFNTRNQRPRALNLLQAENNIYGSNWLSEYLDVAKVPPSIPIECAYENDATVTVNNLRKKIFRFKYRFWYSDNQKSTWGSISEIPVPYNYTDPQSDTDPTKNCRIGCVIQTGDASVVKIEIAAQESLGNVFSNFFSVILLDKSDLTISSNDVYVWRFYNSEAYVFVDLDESILDYDYVPDRANSQELLNGNVIIYGGIREGLDPVIPNVTMSTDIEYPLVIDYTKAFSVTQYGTNGFVTGENIHIVLLGTIRRGQTFRFAVLVGATTFTITYTALIGDTTTEVLVGLSLSATGQGFTQVSITANELILSRSGQILLRNNITTTDQTISADFVINHAANTVFVVNGSQYEELFYKDVQFSLLTNTLNQPIFTVVSVVSVLTNLIITVKNTIANETILNGTLYFINPINNSIPAYNASSKENWCLIYRDEKGKTNGATTSPNFNVNTKTLGLTQNAGTVLFYVPFIQTTISHRPPLWAKTYQWGRTANLTKQSWLYWVTNATYKDDKFAYISIESINAYNRVNKNSIISYQFTPGDRIKFYILYSGTGAPLNIYGNTRDYEIAEEIINPDINGVPRIGQFIKIVLPELDSDFNFGTGLSLDYNYYYIELYTPAKSAAEGLDVYYEFSEEFGIGNWGTPNAFHQGMSQNQSADLVSPAIFRFDKGDAWYRTRVIGIGNTILYDVTPQFNSLTLNTGGGTFSLYPYVFGLHLNVQAYTSNDYVIAQDVVPHFLLPINYNQPGAAITTSVNAITFNVRGEVNVTAQQTNGADWYVEVFIKKSTDPPNSAPTIVLLDTFTGATQGTLMLFSFNGAVTVPPNSKAWFTLRTFGTNVPFSFNVVSGFVSFTEPDKDFEVGVVDANFSDFYASKVNSNGKAEIVHPDEKTNTFDTLQRWGLSYVQNTNINQINRFMPLNFNEVDRAKGAIQRMVVSGYTLLIFQNRAVGAMGIYGRFIQNSDLESQLVTTNVILTKTNIKYYAGDYGLGDQYTGLVVANRVVYFVDPVRGYQIRLSDDGFTPISEIYKGQFYIRNLLTPYNKTYLRANGATAKILGCYNFFDEEYVALLQGGTNSGNTIDSYAFSFNERRNGYCSFFSYKSAEWLLSAEDIIYSWKNGNLYSHNNTDAYANFYGIQYEVSITIVFNINLLEKKSWESITELANAIWSCPVIYSNVMSYGQTRQETMLGEYDFANLESNFHAAILRDQNSIGGIINGDEMKGNYLCVKLMKQNASDLIYLSEVSIMFKDSPLTNK